MDARHKLGSDGESLAAHLYRRDGFTIVERNYRCPVGEIDLVARRGNLLVFCEVKTRRTARWGAPWESVGRAKQARLRRLATAWLADRRPGRCEIRFDVVSVVQTGHEVALERVTDAF